MTTKSNRQFHWFKTNPAEILTDQNVERMSLSAFGLHSYLLLRSWIDNGIPYELAEIARYPMLRGIKKSRLEALWFEVEPCWPESEQGRARANPEQEQDRGRAEARTNHSRISGNRGAFARWNSVENKQSIGEKCHDVAIENNGLLEVDKEVEVEVEVEVEKTTTISSATPPKRAKKVAGEMVLNAEQQAWWDEFWNEGWPKNRKVDRIRAQKAFFAYVTDNGKFEDVMMGLAMTLPSWETKESRFIPHPATWLNGHRWEDAPEEVPLFQFKFNGDR